MKRKPTAEEREAIQSVLYHLECYQGEEILKNVHALHLSIQKLESLCRSKGSEWTTNTQAKLYQPACDYWFKTLWASREGYLNHDPQFIAWSEPYSTKGRHPEFAIGWASLLKDELQSWLTEGIPND